MKEVSLVGLIFCLFGAISLVFRGAISGNNIVAVSIQVMAAILMLWARLTLGQRSFHASAAPTEGVLINAGPYKFLRHPIYASILYFFWAGLSSHFSLINLVLTLAISIGLLFRIRAEEFLLSEKYSEYKIYSDKTKRIIPFII